VTFVLHLAMTAICNRRTINLHYDDNDDRDLEISVRGHSESFELVPFDSLDGVSYSPSTVTMTVSLTVYEIFSVKVLRDLENWVRDCSRSLKMAPYYTTFYWSAIVNIALSGTAVELFDVE